MLKLDDITRLRFNIAGVHQQQIVLINVKVFIIGHQVGSSWWINVAEGTKISGNFVKYQLAAYASKARKNGRFIVAKLQSRAKLSHVCNSSIEGTRGARLMMRKAARRVCARRSPVSSSAKRFLSPCPTHPQMEFVAVGAAEQFRPCFRNSSSLWLGGNQDQLPYTLVKLSTIFFSFSLSFFTGNEPESDEWFESALALAQRDKCASTKPKRSFGQLFLSKIKSEVCWITCEEMIWK